MTTSATEPAVEYVMNSLEAEWQRVKPPDFWTSVRHAEWPAFEYDAFDRIATASPERMYVLLFAHEIGDGDPRFGENNTGQLFPFLRVWTTYVVKETADLQRQMVRAAVDMQNLYLGNPGRNHPEATTTNDYGLTTVQTPGTRIRFLRPNVAGDYGIGFVYGAFDIGYIHPWPKG